MVRYSGLPSHTQNHAHAQDTRNVVYLILRLRLVQSPMTVMEQHGNCAAATSTPVQYILALAAEPRGRRLLNTLPHTLTGTGPSPCSKSKRLFRHTGNFNPGYLKAFFPMWLSFSGNSKATRHHFHKGLCTPKAWALSAE